MKTWADKTICKICGKEVSKCSLSSHLKWSHNKMTYKEYFDTYEEPYEHNCPYCGKECKWIGKGGRHYAQTCGSKECLSKIHSDNNGGGTPETLRKIKQTKLERYGNENYQNTEKIRQTCLERYGVDNPAKLDSIKSKIQDTIIKNNIHRNTGNYGVYYNGEKFDSKSELLYYYWCKENGFDIIKNPTPIEYYIEGVRHLYYPDFIVNGQYVEIKGEHLIDNDGYLYYELSYNSSLLMNGLKECNTEDYSIKDINSKPMWLDFLDNYGGRINADGLDNFYDLMIDPITA